MCVCVCVCEREREREKAANNINPLSPVKAKHVELVPAKMSEEEFWLQFFQSQLFHRDSLPGKTSKKNFLSDILTTEQRCKFSLCEFFSVHFC